MEADLVVYVRGNKPIIEGSDPPDPRLNPDYKHVHISIKDDSGSEEVFNEVLMWDWLVSAINDMRTGKHRNEENRFGTNMTYYWY